MCSWPARTLHKGAGPDSFRRGPLRGDAAGSAGPCAALSTKWPVDRCRRRLLRRVAEGVDSLGPRLCALSVSPSGSVAARRRRCAPGRGGPSPRCRQPPWYRIYPGNGTGGTAEAVSPTARSNRMQRLRSPGGRQAALRWAVAGVARRWGTTDVRHRRRTAPCAGARNAAAPAGKHDGPTSSRGVRRGPVTRESSSLHPGSQGRLEGRWAGCAAVSAVRRGGSG